MTVRPVGVAPFMADNTPTHEPHRPNYAELKNEHAEALQHEQQQQENTPEPPRPEGIYRGVTYPDSGGMEQQQTAALADHDRRNSDEWKRMAKDPDYAQQKQRELEQQRGNEGPEHDHTGGRER